MAKRTKANDDELKRLLQRYIDDVPYPIIVKTYLHGKIVELENSTYSESISNIKSLKNEVHKKTQDSKAKQKKKVLQKRT